MDATRVDEQTQLLFGLDHPHIIKVYPDLRIPQESALAKNPYMVMEKAMITLDQFHSYGVEHIETIFSQLLDAVGHLHANGFVHRDLKPQNVLLRDSPETHVLLSAFDTAKGNTPLSKFCGTVKYAAPEVAAAQQDDPEEEGFYTIKADVWSLGVMLLDFVLEDGLPLPAVEPSRHLKYQLIQACNAHVISTLNNIARTGYEQLHEVAKMMLVIEAVDRPHISICQVLLRGAVRNNDQNIGPPTPTEVGNDTEDEQSD